MAAPPAMTAVRLAYVPVPVGEAAVSPSMTRTSSKEAPSSWATICASDVSWPWP
jgi:hypothetical protein